MFWGGGASRSRDVSVEKTAGCLACEAQWPSLPSMPEALGSSLTTKNRKEVQRKGKGRGRRRGNAKRRGSRRRRQIVVPTDAKMKGFVMQDHKGSNQGRPPRVEKKTRASLPCVPPGKQQVKQDEFSG